MSILFFLFVVFLASFLTLFIGYQFLVYALTLIPSLSPSALQRSQKPQPISILVPTIVGGDLLKEKLRNLLDQDYPRQLMDVIVIDSSDEPSGLESDVTVIRQAVSGKPAALNEGLRHAEHEIVVITDDDAVLDKHALSNLVSYFEDPRVGGVVSDLTLGGQSLLTKMNASFYRLFRNTVRRWESHLDSVSFASGELLAFRKSLVSEIDPTVLSDDLYLLFEIRKRGYRVVSSEARAFEEDVPSLRGQINHKRRTMIGTLQVFSKYREVLLDPKYGLFGLFIAPMYLARVTAGPVLLLILEVLAGMHVPLLVSLLLDHPYLIALSSGLAFTLLVLSRRSAGAVLYGLVVQISALAGIVDYLTGNYDVGWRKKGK